MHQDLSKLVQRAQKGDRDAFYELIAQTESRLFRFCLYISSNQATAEDLCQETYLRALRKIRGLKNPERIMSWLFRISRNLFLDYAKSAWSTQVTADAALVEASSSSSKPEAILEILQIQRCLKVLNPEDRLLLLLVDQQGFSYREVAEIIGISEAAVTSRLHRARQMFLEEFEKQ